MAKFTEFRVSGRNLGKVTTSIDIVSWVEVLLAKERDKKVDMDSYGDKLGVHRENIHPTIAK